METDNGSFQTIVHIAGEPEGNLQRCVRCGAILVDANGVMTMDGQSMMFWAGSSFIGESECVREGRKLSTGCSFMMSRDAIEADEYPCGALT